MKHEKTAVSNFEFTLLNDFQRDFPLLPRPFVAIAEKLGSDEASVIGSLRRLQQQGAVSRVGAVFQPHAIGASVLAALAAPQHRLEEVAGLISAFPEVNHNYAREHRFNLWFVATAPSPQRLRAALQEIETACQCGPLLVLPMHEQYHIDLGFDLAADAASAAPPLGPISNALPATATLSASERTLVAALQDGLPLVERPFACLGLEEAQAIATVSRWLDGGVIKRFGVIVRHHELGYVANAMAVWDVPDEVVSEVGKRIAGSGRVSLCYRRARQLPEWRYNLFCMFHGGDRGDVAARVAALSDACGLSAYPHDVLFSLRRFKQRGAHYAPAREVVHG